MYISGMLEIWIVDTVPLYLGMFLCIFLTYIQLQYSYPNRESYYCHKAIIQSIFHIQIFIIISIIPFVAISPRSGSNKELSTALTCHSSFFSLIWNSFLVSVSHHLDILEDSKTFILENFFQFGFVWCFFTFRFRACIFSEKCWKEDVVSSVYLFLTHPMCDHLVTMHQQISITVNFLFSSL